MPTLCAFGSFDLQGARSWVIRTGMEARGYRISYCNTQAKGLWNKHRDLRNRWKECESSADALYVVFLGHYLMPLAWWLARRKKIPVIFDAFLSLYDTDVSDRKRYARWHPWAAILWLTDFVACHLADRILLDTEEHREYFIRRYHLRPEKVLVLPVGCRTDLFLPIQPSPLSQQGRGQGEGSGGFTVEFHGTFIPLQGIETILRAAKILENHNVRFKMIGKGQTFPAMQKLAEELALMNICFLGSLPMEEIPKHIAEADVCLGIFGTTAKARRVIPTKAYEIINCSRPLITAYSAASAHIFHDRESALLVNPGDPQALADAILLLKNDPLLARTIAENGRKYSLEHFQPGMVVGPVVEFLRNVECRIENVE
ncbi:MAG: glycosyltransferase family 4 protein [Candidatus Peregrinibacteria bacterium]